MQIFKNLTVSKSFWKKAASLLSTLFFKCRVAAVDFLLKELILCVKQCYAKI